MIGVLGTAALQQAWGVTIWNQWDVYDAMLERSFTGPMRFFVFLLAVLTTLFDRYAPVQEWRRARLADTREGRP